MDTNTINKLKENFRMRNIEVECFEDLTEVKNHILKIKNVPLELVIQLPFRK